MNSNLVDVFLLSLVSMFNPTLLAAVTVMLLLPLSGLPGYAEPDSWSNAASGGVVLRVRIIRAL